MNLFYFLGKKLYERLEQKRGRFYKKQPSYDIRNLYPGKNAEEKLKEYYTKKIANVLCILSVGILLSGITLVKVYMENIIINEKYIMRNAYGQGAVQAELKAGFEDGSAEEITVQVGERHFTESELQEMYEQAKDMLAKTIFAEGDNPEEVKGNLYLPEALEGFPFQIRWESSNYALVDYDGEVYNEELQDIGDTVTLSAVFRYNEFKREYIFSVHILPPSLSKEQLRSKALAKSIEENESISACEEQYVLPDFVNGEAVTWKEIKENYAAIILLLAFLTAATVYCMKDYDLHKQVLLRQEEMFECYPEIVNRLVLYVGAGMTVRNAWRKIALDYERAKKQGRRKGYIYKEMLFACYEMDSGIAEGDAYERFGRRCGIQQYIKLATLLVQNMQKGNSTMLAQLKEEAETAFTQRMSQARKKGEEAGTKLLMPMMLLFGMVMVLIIIPAFGTFGT